MNVGGADSLLDQIDFRLYEGVLVANGHVVHVLDVAGCKRIPNSPDNVEERRREKVRENAMGGDQKEIEDGTYLIQAQDTTVKIQIKTSGLHYDR